MNSEQQEAPEVMFVDLYFEGFHVGKTFRYTNTSLEDAVSLIRKAQTMGFMPSWNPETNKASSQLKTPVVAQPRVPQVHTNTSTEWQEEDKQELGNCRRCGAPNKLSQKGKVYCSKLCWKNG
jgi:hypothetical protein